MKKMLKSKEGISPILATLLLIVIAVAAVIVTYAWVMTFTSSTTGQSGAILNPPENIRYYNDSGTLKVDITIRNSGTADAKVATVYKGTSSSNLQPVSTVTYDPDTQIVGAGSSLKMTFNLSWTEGTRYYFKVVTEEGHVLPFSEEA